MIILKWKYNIFDLFQAESGARNGSFYHMFPVEESQNEKIIPDFEETEAVLRHMVDDIFSIIDTN